MPTIKSFDYLQNECTWNYEMALGFGRHGLRISSPVIEPLFIAQLIFRSIHRCLCIMGCSC